MNDKRLYCKCEIKDKILVGYDLLLKKNNIIKRYGFLCNVKEVLFINNVFWNFIDIVEKVFFMVKYYVLI